ncbi:retrovirus-related pol polyprotein from transposon TNT 1-94 [Tanacetum coccineum]
MGKEFQLSCKVLPPEWSKFVTDVKLVRDLHTTKFDQLNAPSFNHHPQKVEFPHLDSGLTAPVFKPSDGPIDAINKMMSFLSTVVTSCFPSTNNQLRNSFNPRQQATIQDGSGKVWNKEELEFLADPGIAKGPVTHSIITHNAAYQADDLDAYDSDCNDISTAKAVLMANLSSYGSDVLSGKLKGKEIVDNVAHVSNATTNAPGMYKLDPVILAPKVKNNREAHEYYLKHNMEQATILREELLGYVRDTCPDIHKPRVNLSTSASGSKPSGNIKIDRISRTPSSNEKNKIEIQSRKVKSKLNKLNSDSKNVCNKHVKHPVKGSRGTNLYSLSIGDMMASSSICLLSKATKTKSWLWHRRLSHLNFGALNHLARNGLLMAMASEQSNLEPALHEMTPATLSLGLIPNPPPSASFVPPSRHEWDLVFQPVFDELFSLPASVVIFAKTYIFCKKD